MMCYKYTKFDIDINNEIQIFKRNLLYNEFDFMDIRKKLFTISIYINR